MPNLMGRVNREEDGKCVCIVSGELDGDFAGEATFNDHAGVNQSSGDDSMGKQREKKPIRPFQRRKYLHIV